MNQPTHHSNYRSIVAIEHQEEIEERNIPEEHTSYKMIFQISRSRSRLSSRSIPSQSLSTSTSIFANLKLKIASSLTSSLSASDRDKLLESLGINVSEQDQKHLEIKHHENQQKGTINTSIGEAVAAAVAKEAAKNNALAAKQKDEIWKHAEKATMERVKNDLLIQERTLAMERWQRELEAEKKRVAQEEQVQEQDQDRDREKKQEITATAATSAERDETMHHPVLGPTIVDLGYKRIHLASVQTLSAIPIWEKQRVYRHDRAKTMASDKLKSLELGLPGVIALHESVDGFLSILDGQHRVGMMTILQEKAPDGQAKLNFNQILVEVFPQSPSATDDHAQDIFTEINKAEPVKLVDMPGVAKIQHRRIINDASSDLHGNFPDMFKPSQRCRAPHLNVDNLRDAIFAAGIIEKHGFKSKNALLKWILEKNEEMGKKYRKEGSHSHPQSALTKTKKFGFFLGLDSSWLYK